MSTHAAQRTFTVDEYYRMGDAGILTEEDRVELLEGRIFAMSPIGSRHAACVNRLNVLLNRHRGHIISVQNPIRLDEYSEPQPDVAVLRHREDFYADAHPAPEDVLLVVEVMDSSKSYDRDAKVHLYAAAGIPEVWLIDLNLRMIEVYAQPSEGAYREVQRVTSGTIPSDTMGRFSIEDFWS